MREVGQAIEQRRGEALLAEDLGPVREPQVRGDADRDPLVEGGGDVVFPRPGLPSMRIDPPFSM